MVSFRYGRWDNSQEPFPATTEDLMEAISDDLMNSGDLQRALRKLAMRGLETPDGQNIEGLRQMMDRLRQQRQEHLDRYNLDSVMDGVKEKLDEIKDLENQTLSDHLRDAQDAVGDEAPDSAQPDPSGGRPEGGDPENGGAQQGEQGANERRSVAAQEADLAQFLKDLEEEIERARDARESRAQDSPESDSGDEKGQKSEDGQDGGAQKGGQQGSEMDSTTARTLRGLAERKMQFMEGLPADPGGMIRELSEYEFMDEEAREKFKELLDSLRQEAMNSYMQNMMQQMQNVSPEQMNATKEMLKDLNEMLQDRLQGREPKFDEFMQNWGPLFGGDPPQNLDELLEQLASQMSQMQSIMDSLPDDLRQQLQDTMEAAMNDPELQQQMAQLSSMMNSLMPMEDMRQNYPFAGEENLSLGEAMRLMEELQRMDELEAQMRGAERRGDMNEVDEESLRDLLGEDSARNLDWLKRLQEELEKAGYIRKNDKDRMELTPKGIRKIGEKALKDLFSKLRQDRLGAHEMPKHGILGEKTEEDTKQYEFGDPFNIHMVRTVKNAVFREGIGTPLRLQPDDFEVYRDEQLTQASTVILLDQSRSMAISGSFEAAKKVALALHTLIKMQYPRDHLYVVGFADYAWELKGDDLVKATWGGYSPGTNMQHALMLSRQLLNKHRVGTRQVIMVTDGEPTAHLEGGAPYFSYPPSPRTLDQTLREVRRCTQEGIVINVFMLEMAYYLVNFVRQMTKLNKGRAFFTSPDKLGEYVLVDYLNNKRSGVA
jgi:uncharacterized protein with von Willebrand factor type A (vWA) domain